MKRPCIILMLLLILIAGCAPAQSARDGEVALLPTTAPDPTQDDCEVDPDAGAEEAQRTALTFLEAWQGGDYTTMYQHISTASQQNTPFEAFTTAYTRAAITMTLNSLSYQPNAMLPDPNNRRVMLFDYDVTFATTVLGDFTDSNRTLHLVLDDCGWRVAWTAGAIFAEMGSGGRLQLEPATPRRASIYDRAGAVLAEQNGRMVTVNIVPDNVSDMDVCLNTLAGALERDVTTLRERIVNFRPDWLGEVGMIEPLVYEVWESILVRDCEAQFGYRSTRRYPEGTLAPHIVGTVGFLQENEIAAAQAAGFTQDAILGRSGIEGAWDEVLRGQPGGRLRVVTIDGEVMRVIAESTSMPSRSVYLTLDANLQRSTVEIIAQASELWSENVPGAAAVVLDVNTGAILAMVSWPGYDANILAPYPEMGRDAANATIAELEADDEGLPLLNRATQGSYPAGSTMKVITSMAAAEAGVFPPEELFGCGGIWERDGDVRYDWLPGGHGTLNMMGAIRGSCNPYFYEAGYRLAQQGPDILSEYARRFGLGIPTGLTDITESPGFIGDSEWVRTNAAYPIWTFRDVVSMAIGQGFVEVTPLQMARLYAAIANGGTLYRPQLVESVRLIDEYSYRMTPEITGTFDIDAAILDVVRSGLCAVTTNQAGTAEFVFRNSELQTFGVCGKTGTATDQGTNPGNDHAWFLGYAPREAPEIAVVVIVENGGQGSEVAAPIVRDIMESYFFDD